MEQIEHNANWFWLEDSKGKVRFSDPSRIAAENYQRMLRELGTKTELHGKHIPGVTA